MQSFFIYALSMTSYDIKSTNSLYQNVEYLEKTKARNSYWFCLGLDYPVLIYEDFIR